MIEFHVVRWCDSPAVVESLILAKDASLPSRKYAFYNMPAYLYICIDR